MKNLNLLTDEELVALYSKGDNGAFDVLLLRHKNRIYSYVFYIVKDRELAEDIFQETFVKVITTIKQGRYVESGKFSSWITRIAHNLIINIWQCTGNDNRHGIVQKAAFHFMFNVFIYISCIVNYHLNLSPKYCFTQKSGLLPILSGRIS